MTTLNGVKSDHEPKLHWQKIHADQNEELRICGYERSLLGTFLTTLSFILSIGWVRLLFHWYPQLYLYATHKKCHLARATKLLIVDNYQGKYKSYFVKDVKIISISNSAERCVAYADKSGKHFLENIKGKKLKINLENGTQCEVFEYRAFWCKKQCYIWDITQNVFSKLVGLDKYTLCSNLHLEQNEGLSKDEQLLRRIVYGYNDIIVPVQNILVLFLLEVLNPFYIFQVFTLCVWFAEGYYYYTAAIIFMSSYGIISTILQTRKNQIKLRGTIASTETVCVRRSSGTFECISSNELVPGDIIQLPKHQGIITCDAVLLTGQCILNESMLTGESVPVTKTPLPSYHRLYDPKECSHHTLYSGTSIVQTKSNSDEPVLARVIRTGLLTDKGKLVAAILYPPPADFKFDQDSYKFIGILAVIAACGFLYTVITKVYRGITLVDIVIKSLDILTIVIPPALPAAMTVGKLYAQARLKREQISCINSRVINVSGSVNCICFDKTGTLTEDGLDMWGVVPCKNGSFGDTVKDVPKLRENHKGLFDGMLVCHSLTLIDGQLCGDPLDVKMFESTGWTLEENTTSIKKYEFISPRIVKPPKSEQKVFVDSANDVEGIEIMHQFQFSSSLQRMTVIIRDGESDYLKVYTKGSPEMILSLSKGETIPENIVGTLKHYTEQGYRVIAMGRNIISENLVEISQITRDVVEQNLEFLGLIVMENRLKKATIPVIKELKEANMRLIMITGDNIQTAVSVAKECGILSSDETIIDVNIILDSTKSLPKIFFTAQGLPPGSSIKTKGLVISAFRDIERGLAMKKYRFAITGQIWQLLREYYQDILAKICVRGVIFARMNSEQKQQLVVELMQLGYYVIMCGDGANDCGALRAAHAGVSLSEAESSVASPFTSRIPDITCIPTVIRQGRAALVTSFGIFKFVVTYSLTEFLSVVILYWIDSNVTDLEFLFIDIFLVVNFAFFFGKTKAYEGKLAKKPPETSLLSFTSLLSLTLQITVITIFQLIAFQAVKRFSWFVPFVQTDDTTAYACYENYSVFCVSMFQYITMAVVFSRGKPYRKAMYTNNVFILSIFILTVICAYITVYPANWVIKALQLMVPPVYDWRIIILALAFVNFFVCLFVEMFIIEYVVEKKLKTTFYRPERSKKRYLRIEHELNNKPDWPKLDDELPVLPITPSVETMVKLTHENDVDFGNNMNDRSRKQECLLMENDRTDIKKCGIENIAYVPDESYENANTITRL